MDPPGFLTRYPLITRRISLSLFFFTGILSRALAQCPNRSDLARQISTAESASGVDSPRLLRALNSTCLRCGYGRDSLRARVLHRLGVASFAAGQLDSAIRFTRQAIAVSHSGVSAVRPDAAVRSWFNLGYFYQQQIRYPQATQALEACVRLGSRYPVTAASVADAYRLLANIHQKKGDYQRAITYAEAGLVLAHRLREPYLLTNLYHVQAQALNDWGRQREALIPLQQSIRIAKANTSEAGSLPLYYNLLGNLQRDLGEFVPALGAYRRAVALLDSAKNKELLASIELNVGFLHYLRSDYKAALRSYQNALRHTTQAQRQARLYDNIGAVFWQKKAFPAALAEYQRGLMLLAVSFRDPRLAVNPSARSIQLTTNKEYLLTLIQDKADTWLAWANATGNQQYFQNALATYRTADQMIDFMRWEHTGEESKRFWREKTHRLYENAIETCHRLNRPEDAFYFFEKSRAALLSDRLNELGASQLLAPTDQKREADLQKTVSELRQKASEAKPGDKTGDSLRQALLSEEEAQTAFVRSVETRNPAYFRYRYDTSAVRLQTVREKLLTEGQTLLEYFVGDSAVYALTVTATSAKLTRLAVKAYAQTTRQLLALSADAAALNQQFPEFLKKSHRLFQQLFAPLDVLKGRVIVSPDGAIFPLELLSRSPTRPDWLLRDYAFSYTYSAQFLIKQASRRPLVSGSFLGLAPVAFASGQPTLGGSDASLTSLGGGFFSPTLLRGSEATKRAFLRELPRHRVAQLYAHAQADSSGREPEIFFADSSLRASELSGLGLLPTQLVVLSACQTGVGQTTRGEGVFSLARSLALAGVPSTVTTLWRVDNVATYRLTELFFEKIGNGLPADQALQQAKLAYLAAAPGSRALPPFWAGMVLIGSAEPLESGTSPWVWVGGGVALLGLSVWGWRRKQKLSR